MTATCVRCANENHEGCDGGAWDDALKPTVCECFMRYHHAEVRRTYTPKPREQWTVKETARFEGRYTTDDQLADYAADRWDDARQGAA